MYYSSKEKDDGFMYRLNWGAKAITPAALKSAKNVFIVWISLWIWHNFKADTLFIKKYQSFLRLLDGKCASNNMKFTH